MISFGLFFFFFSSRRRHTRFDCDWSSDVCSSDLADRRALWTPSTFIPISRASMLVSTLVRSEEHTSELQSQSNLVCRLLLEKKKKTSHLCIVLDPSTPNPCRMDLLLDTSPHLARR